MRHSERISLPFHQRHQPPFQNLRHCQWMDLSCHSAQTQSAVCWLWSSAKKQFKQTNQPAPKPKQPKTPIPLPQNQWCCSCESYLNQHTLAISVRVFCDRSHSKNPSINGSITDVRKVLNSVLHQKVWNRKKALKL